jgi:hypothetical protein
VTTNPRQPAPKTERIDYMLYDIIYSIGLIAIAGLIAFFIGKKMAAKPGTKSKTTTFLMKSIQAIAELAVLEYRTEGVTEIKEKKKHLITVRWKRGLLRYTTNCSGQSEKFDYDHTFMRNLSLIVSDRRIQFPKNLDLLSRVGHS